MAGTTPITYIDNWINLLLFFLSSLQHMGSTQLWKIVEPHWDHICQVTGWRQVHSRHACYYVGGNRYRLAASKLMSLEKHFALSHGCDMQLIHWIKDKKYFMVRLELLAIYFLFWEGFHYILFNTHGLFVFYYMTFLHSVFKWLLRNILNIEHQDAYYRAKKLKLREKVGCFYFKNKHFHLIL